LIHVNLGLSLRRADDIDQSEAALTIDAPVAATAVAIVTGAGWPNRRAWNQRQLRKLT